MSARTGAERTYRIAGPRLTMSEMSTEAGTDRRKHHARRKTDRGPLLSTRWNDLHGPARALVWLLILLTFIQVYREANFIVSRVFSVLLLFIFAAIIALLVDPLVQTFSQLPGLRGRRV